MNALEARNITNDVLAQNPDIPKILADIFESIEAQARNGEQQVLFRNPAGPVKDAIYNQLQERGFKLSRFSSESTVVYW